MYGNDVNKAVRTAAIQRTEIVLEKKKKDKELDIRFVKSYVLRTVTNYAIIEADWFSLSKSSIQSSEIYVTRTTRSAHASLSYLRYLHI